MLKVSFVPRGSIADQLHIKKGDEILSFDGYKAVDEMDYIYADSLSSFQMEVKRGEKVFTLSVEKDEYDSLEIGFEPNEKIRTCYNHCVFCFVDQMPKGMRDSLYVKDDDYTMSFACGNFVTLTNMSDEDLDRVIRLHLSPLYVSVQTMNEELRCELLRNRFAGKITKQIEKLASAGIVMHTQSVIVPGKNDFDDMEKTARKLFSYYPTVRDMAVVPTGITKFREGLYPIPDVDGEYAGRFLDLVDQLNAEFGVNFILPADEYFIKAKREMKPAEFYGEFEQIENGIGMTTKFVGDFLECLKRKKLKKPKKTLSITGTSAYETIENLCVLANEKVQGLDAHALCVKNKFFGESVTCTGLLVGQDILEAILPYAGKVDEIVLSANTMREFEDVFLDDMTLEELKEKSNIQNIRVNRDGGSGFFAILSTLK